jgi:hypothetical protein
MRSGMFGWVWTGLIGIVALLVAFASYRTTGNELDVTLGFFVLGPLMLITALGSVVSVRQPGNRIGWLLHIVSLDLLLSLWTYPLVLDGNPDSPSFVLFFAVVIQNAVAPLLIYVVFLLLFLFPTGTFLSPRWKWAGLIGVTYFSLLLFFAIFATETGPVFLEGESQPWAMPNPIGFLPTGPVAALSDGLALLMLAAAIGGVSAIVLRYRRAGPVVRTQIKWVLFAAVAALVSFPIAISDLEVVSDILMMITITAVPTAIAIAITRYRLYEIDRIISRTVTYTLVAAAVAAIYLLPILTLPRLLGESNDLVTAASTLAAAAVFNPLRRRTQRAVDRRFNRARYHTEQELDAYATRLADHVDLHTVTTDLQTVVARTLTPTTTSTWIRHHHT